MKTKRPAAKKPTSKQEKDKRILEMSNLILQRNIDAYKELAAYDKT